MNNLIYIGAVELSHHGLDELIKHGVKPALVVTLHPTLSRRHSDFVDIGALAEEHQIPVLHVNNINDAEAIAAFRAVDPDYIFVIGWSQIIGDELLALPRKSCVGFHFAKLPRNRGRAAIPWVILNGERETGVTLMHLDAGVDSGDLIMQRTIPITPDEVARTLYEKICAGLRDMMGETAALLKAGSDLPAAPQDHTQATYLAKRTADDGWIDWDKPAADIARHIRAAGEPYPGAFTIYKDKPLVIWEARERRAFNQVGTVGQVLSRDTECVTVQCGEGWVDLLVVENDSTGGRIAAPDFFTRMHDKLGINLFSLWKQVQELNAQLAKHTHS